MIRNKLNNAWLKWLLGILIAVVILLGAVTIYLNAKWKPLVADKIHKGIFKASNGLYQIQFKDIELNLLTGNMVLDTVTLMPDTAALRRLKATGKNPLHTFKISLAHLKISRLSVWNAAFNKRLRLNTIILEEPTIDMVRHAAGIKGKSGDTANKTLYQLISNTFRSVRVNGIHIKNANFDYYKNTERLQSVKKLNADFKDFLVDTNSETDTSRVLYCKNIGFNLVGYQSKTKDKMYQLKLDTLEGSLNKRTLKIKGFKMIPQYPDLAFSRKYSTQKDRYNFSFSSITLAGIDFIELNQSGDLTARSISVGPASVAVFMNRELPPVSFDKAKNFPIAALQRAPINLTVDTLRLKQVDVAYTEYNPKAKERGTAHLKNLSGSILNVTNDSISLAKKSHAVADLTTYVMGAGKMNVNIDFDLTDKNLAFNYDGKVDAFDMTALNPLSKPLGLVAIESGKLNSASFSVNANKYGAKGTVKFLYNDLKIQMLGEDNGKKEKKGLLSFLANTLLVKNNNPDKGEAPRVANVTHVREPQASFFNLMWKTVFKGIRENAGVGIVPMKKMAKDKKK